MERLNEPRFDRITTVNKLLSGDSLEGIDIACTRSGDDLRPQFGTVAVTGKAEITKRPPDWLLVQALRVLTVGDP